MLALNFPKTLKSRLILYFLAITIVPSVTVSYFYFKNSQYTLEKNMINTSMSNLDYSTDIIDKQLKNAEQLSDWIFINKSLDTILTKDYPGVNYRSYDQIKAFLDLVDYQLRYNASIGTHLFSLIIHGKNGLDLRAGQPEGTQIEIAEIEKTKWFKKGIELQGKKYWYGIIPNPSTSTIKYEAYILPLVRPIVHSFTIREIGWQMIGFRVSLISDLFKNLEILPDETLLVMDSRGFCVYHNKNNYIGQDLKKLDFIQTILNGEMQGSLRIKMEEGTRLVVYDKSELTGWSIVKILSSAELNRQKRTLFGITLIILFSSFIFTSLLTIFLSSNLTRPLTKLLQKTKAIAAGNFDRDPSIEGEDELGLLGCEINEMAENIKSLLERMIENEQEKRRLELELLQNQVNPHFLYNALNSLKLMATIQKADGIKEMVTALGRLLMNLSKNTAEKITLEEEIALLNDYVYIQNIRYKGKIKLEYSLDDYDYLQCMIIKFTLQPIVENAIFHGVEPKKDAGRILINVSEQDGQLIICIEDDGVGMTSEQINSILTTPVDKTRGLSKIGLKNVDDRIKLVYGSQYGLTIESVVGEYTRVYLKIPREFAED